MGTGITDDMMKLLHIIQCYTQSTDDENPTWIKELPLMAIIYQGIIDGVFKDYDYAPWSVPMLDGTRQWLNISREGKDDLEDLLNLRYLAILRLSTSHYGFVTAYKLTETGQVLADTVDLNLKEQVASLIRHRCGSLHEVIVNGSRITFLCKECGDEKEIQIGNIEDIPYATKAYLPSVEFD
ncbi:MAG: hypothetical protein ACFFED_14245 [Candidatus Thorarchaeota archaeon]